MEDCPLCRKLAQPPSEELIAEFPHSLAFLGPWQFYHGYAVLVSRTHARELHELPDAGRRAFLDEMCTLARAIHQAFRPQKLNCELLGNQVSHLHWHVFPRYKSDPDLLKPVWLSLDRAEGDEALRQRLRTGPEGKAQTVNRLRSALARS